MKPFVLALALLAGIAAAVPTAVDVDDGDNLRIATYRYSSVEELTKEHKDGVFKSFVCEPKGNNLECVLSHSEGAPEQFDLETMCNERGGCKPCKTPVYWDKMFRPEIFFTCPFRKCQTPPKH